MSGHLCGKFEPKTGGYIDAILRFVAEGTIVDPEEHDDAVESCICDFMEGARAAIENTYPSGHLRQEVLLQCFM